MQALQDAEQARNPGRGGAPADPDRADLRRAPNGAAVADAGVNAPYAREMTLEPLNFMEAVSVASAAETGDDTCFAESVPDAPLPTVHPGSVPASAGPWQLPPVARNDLVLDAARLERSGGRSAPDELAEPDAYGDAAARPGPDQDPDLEQPARLAPSREHAEQAGADMPSLSGDDSPPYLQAPARPAGAARSTSRRLVLVAGIGAVTLGLAGVFGYIYMQLGTDASAPDTLAQAPAPLPMPPGAGAANPGEPAAAATASPAADTRSADPAAATLPPVQPVQASQPSQPSQATASAPDPHPRLLPSAPAAPAPAQALADGERIDIRRGSTGSAGATLQAAYRAWQQGDNANARQLYQKVLGSDQNNRDALLGLAALALAEGKEAQALALNRQLLALDPLDGDAHAALSGLRQDEAGSAESRLKRVLAHDPQSAPALFALGNVYAGQMRWAEAQDAYFRAFHNNARNPDYAMNLAISLDRLGQTRAALDFYQRALALAATGRASFTHEQASARITELQAVAADQ
ncbi:tetratricopeptide repeat protein [Massilia hydrophila]|nr:tetratricopeptide repeat protein [Massilia oculi]